MNATQQYVAPVHARMRPLRLPAPPPCTCIIRRFRQLDCSDAICVLLRRGPLRFCTRTNKRAPAIETLGLELIGAVGIWGDGRSCVNGAAETTLHSVLYAPALLTLARPSPQPEPLPLLFLDGIGSAQLSRDLFRHATRRPMPPHRRPGARRFAAPVCPAKGAPSHHHRNPHIMFVAVCRVYLRH